MTLRPLPHRLCCSVFIEPISPSERRWRFSASRRANGFLHPSHVNGRWLECSCSCRLQSCWRANPFPQPGHLHWKGFSSLCDRMCPLRLKCRVNVLLHPGTGHTNLASLIRRLILASAVAAVVTFGLATCTGVTPPLRPCPLAMPTLIAPTAISIPIPSCTRWCRPPTPTFGSGSSICAGLAEGLGYGETRPHPPTLRSREPLDARL